MPETDRERIPEPKRRLLYGKCPDCGRRFWNGISLAIGYPMHYSTHHIGMHVLRLYRRDGADG